MLETLESAFRQTYPNLELIISDDGSTDNTCTLCKDWLTKHANRFVRTQLVTSDVNTGTSRNANRGMQQATGEWLKIIAADDILNNDCIEQFLQVVLKNANIKACCSSQTPFKEQFTEENLKPEKNYHQAYFFNPSLSARKQFLVSLFKYNIPSPTFFIQKKLFTDIGGYDNTMRIIEDTPLYYRVLLANEKIHYLNRSTVYYREHAFSSSKTKNERIERWKQEDRKRRLEHYIKPHVSKFTYWLHEQLMKYYFDRNTFSIWKKHIITRTALLLIKTNLIR